MMLVIINNHLNYKILNYFLKILEALLELESNSALNRALATLVKTSFLEQRPLNWKPVKCELVINKKLTEEFIRMYTLI